MASRKIKINVTDDMGGNFSISYSGQVNREKVLQLLDFIDLLGGSTAKFSSEEEAKTKYKRVIQIIEIHYPIGFFTSSDIQRNYEDQFKEPIPLSTVSTYLSRLIDKKIITHEGSSSKHGYKLNRNLIVEKTTR